jgi:hypothetical protein
LCERGNSIVGTSIKLQRFDQGHLSFCGIKVFVEPYTNVIEKQETDFEDFDDDEKIQIQRTLSTSDDK